MTDLNAFVQEINLALSDAQRSCDKFTQVLSEIDESSRLFLIGNGGSFSIASHMATDFTNVNGIRCVTLSDTNMLTCFANDYGYEHAIEKYLSYHLTHRDILLTISSSGQSINMVNAQAYAKLKGVKTLSCTGFKSTNPVKTNSDVAFWVDSNNYNVVEMAHHIFLCGLCEILKDKKSGPGMDET